MLDRGAPAGGEITSVLALGWSGASLHIYSSGGRLFFPPELYLVFYLVHPHPLGAFSSSELLSCIAPSGHVFGRSLGWLSSSERLLCIYRPCRRFLL